MALFDAVGDFLSLLFSKDPGAARGKRELRDARNQLKAVKPAIYRASGDLLLPAFAASLYGAAAALRPVRELLSRSVSAADRRTARRFRDFLIERRLGGGAAALLEGCSYEAMKAKAGNDGAAADAAASAASEDFRVFLKGLDGEAAARAEAELADFERLAELCRYDFARLLSAFDRRADIDSPSYRPNFAAAEGRPLVGELADLYAVAAVPPFGGSVVEDLAALSERLGGEGDGKRFAKAASAARKALAAAASPPALTALLRVLREDPRYVPPEPERAGPFLAEYRARVERRFREDRDRLLREAREGSLSADLAELFPAEDGAAAALDPVSGYDAEIDERLKRLAGISFAWATPLALLKTFDARCLAGGFLEAARRLSEEGFFNNAALRSRLSEAVARLEKCGVRIAAFQDGAQSGGRPGAPTLRKLLDEAEKGADVGEAIERIAKNLDERAKDLVERDTAACRSLAEVVFEVIADFRKPTPELVTNIKTLAASQSKSLVPTLANGYNAIARLLKIMKAYVLVRPIP